MWHSSQHRDVTVALGEPVRGRRFEPPKATHAWWLSIGAFVAYNLNLARFGGCYDDLATRVLPLSILRHGTMSLAPYAHLFPPSSDGSLHYSIAEHGSRLVSVYPPTTALLALPVYVVPQAIWDDLPLLLFSKLIASAMTACSVGLVFAALRRFGAGTRAALVFAAIYAFGTPVFTVAAQSLCQHPASTLGVATTMYAAVRARESARGWAPLGGLAAGMTVAVRPQMVVTLALIALYLLYIGERERGLIVAGSAAPVMATVGYNLALTGEVTGGYALIASRYEFVGFHGNLLEGMVGLLVSPSRGLFVFAPVTVFAIGGAVRAARQRDPLLLAAAGGTVATLLLFAKTFTWWGGWTYGPRYLVETMPLVCLLLYVVFRPPYALKPRIWLGVAFLVLAVASMSVQVVGAFSTRCTWNLRPVDVDRAHERLWDFTDTPVSRCFTDGLRIGGAGLTRTRPLEMP